MPDAAAKLSNDRAKLSRDSAEALRFQDRAGRTTKQRGTTRPERCPVMSNLELRRADHVMTGSAMSAFVSRHIGPRGSETEHMLETVGYASLDALVDAAVPSSIR
ncbi:hypothetical protein QAC19_14195, partial [Staphylococcus aureus]